MSTRPGRPRSASACTRGCAALPGEAVREVRGRGLWAGVDLASMPGREACERLAARGVLAKETHGRTVRLAPPLVISEADLDWGLDRLEEVVTGR